ncbi:MAG: hypothetical protein ACOYXT_01570 [Bacteroidota bacterium]
MTRIIIFFTLGLALTTAAQSQKMIRGFVSDSTLAPLPNVNIKSKITGEFAVSDTLGRFSMYVPYNDTLVFSRIGFQTAAYPVLGSKENILVYLKEDQQVLRPIVIHGLTIPGLKDLPKQSPFRNPNFTPLPPQPGFHGIQTFGPGYVLGGPFSYFSKSEREKRKLKKVQAQHRQSQAYTEIIASEEVKADMMKHYSIDEDEYHRLLALFSEKNPDMMSEPDRNELISALFIFFGEHISRK